MRTALSSSECPARARRALAPRRSRAFALLIAALIVAGLAGAGPARARKTTGVRASAAASWHVLLHPIDPGQLTEMPFGTDSPWLQPWRSALTTRPATQLENAIGINLDVSPSEMAATARLLHDSGFRRARVELPWGGMSYDDPAQIADPASWRAAIVAMRDNHIRPLILLNANSGWPTPAANAWVRLSAPAPAGAGSVSLTVASAAQVVPGLTGFDTTDPYPQRPGDLITNVAPDGTATLSRPLPMSLPAGPVSVTTLRYAPFAPPFLVNGAPNPRFEQTLAGWLTYVKSVAHFVRDTYGSSNFDMEVWNELTFGSAFLDETNYYSPVPDPGSFGSVTDELLKRTVQMLHDPANGLPGVKVGDGFSNQEPWQSGANVPAGTNAIDKHPYVGLRVFPGSPDERGIESLNAFGQPNPSPADGSPVAHARLIPSYRVFMPEYLLTGIQTETLMRDLSPITTSIYGTPHGAHTHLPGHPSPTVWITEDALDAGQASANGLPDADIPEFQAKTALRMFVSFASEGAQAVDLFAAAGGACCQFIPPAFFNAVDANPSSYPASLGGLTMKVVGRMVTTLRGARSIARARQLTLDAIAQQGDGAQFRGFGTPALPALYNRDVLAFFPFQVSAHRFVSAVYVMTRDVTHYYTAHPPPGLTSYDMPAQQFRLTIGNVDASYARVSFSDPLTGASVPARIVSRNHRTVVVQLPATDSPRMLTIDDQPTRASKHRRAAGQRTRG
jgi:hypothetical protein